jgi:hypothetical protein
MPVLSVEEELLVLASLALAPAAFACPLLADGFRLSRIVGIV